MYEVLLVYSSDRSLIQHICKSWSTENALSHGMRLILNLGGSNFFITSIEYEGEPSILIHSEQLVGIICKGVKLDSGEIGPYSISKSHYDC